MRQRAREVAVQRLIGLLFLFVVATLAVAACGGGGSSNALPGSGGGLTSQAHANASLLFHFPPPTSAASSNRSPRYLSGKTLSVVVTITAVNGAPPSPAIPPTILAVAAGQGTCSALTTLGFTCTATVGAVGGNDTFLIQAYSGANRTGSLLSSGSLTVAVASTGTTTVTTPLVLSGNVAGATMVTPSPNPAIGFIMNPGATSATIDVLSDGIAHTTTVNLVFFDASANEIVGPLASPIPVVVSGNGITVTPAGPISQSPQQLTFTFVGTSSGSPGGVLSSTLGGTITIGSGTQQVVGTVTPFIVATSAPGPANLVVGGNAQSLQLQEANATSFQVVSSASAPPSTVTGPVTCSTPSPGTMLCPATGGALSGLSLVPSSTIAGSTTYTIEDGHGIFYNMAATTTPQSSGSGTFPNSYPLAFFTVAPNATLSESSVKLGGIAMAPDGSTLLIAGYATTTGGGYNSYLYMMPSNNCTQSSCPAPSVTPMPLPTPMETPVPSLVGIEPNASIDIVENIPSTEQTVSIPPPSCGATCIPLNDFFSTPAPITQFLSGSDGNMWLLQQSLSGTPPQATATSVLYGLPSLASTLPAYSGFTGTVQGMGQGPVLDGYGASLGMWFTELSLPKLFLADSDITHGSAPPNPPVEYQLYATSSSPFARCATYQGLATPPTSLSGIGAITATTNEIWFAGYSTSGTGTTGYLFAVTPQSTGAPCLAGAFTEPIVNGTSFFPTQFVRDRDGNLWATDGVSNAIVRYTTAGPTMGSATVFTSPSLVAPPGELATDANGNIWFVETGSNTYGVIEVQP